MAEPGTGAEAAVDDDNATMVHQNDKENDTNEASNAQIGNSIEENIKEQEDGGNEADDSQEPSATAIKQGDYGDDDDEDGSNSSDSDDSDSSDDDSSSEEESDDDEDKPSSHNVASAPTAAAGAVPTDEHGHTLSAYEIQRLERIRRNKEYLASLGLEKNKPVAKPAAKKPKPHRRKPVDVKRRSSISRASKAKKITYSEHKKDQKEAAAGKKKEPWQRPKENRAARMERFIHDEFRRIGKEQRHHLKRAKKFVRAADVEYRIAKQRAEKLDRKRMKQLEYQQSAERQEQERRALGGYTARGMLQEVDSRMYEIGTAIRTFDERFNPDWAKQQEENARKLELIDAMDRFPRLLKDSYRSLDLLLLERAPYDPPPPRRGTRKRGRPSLDSTNAGEGEPDSKLKAIESPGGTKASLPSGRWGSLASAITAETLSSSARAQLHSKPSPGDVATEESDSKPAAKPKKRKKDVIPKNVGGWVNPAFAASIDRSWLEADSTPKKFDAASYIPQVGDTVLYYPAGHRNFLEAYPDILGKKTRNITRLTLWDRARKEKAKLEKAAGEEDQANNASQDSGNKQASTWWNDEWLSLIDGDLERYPLLCRVEKTHAEFPPDLHSESKIVSKDDTGSVQVTWAVKKGSKAPKKKETNPSLRLAIMLRPLTPVMPPKQGDDTATSESLTLAPNFYVVTFPTKISPFLVPFSWAYRLSHSLAEDSSIRLPSKPEWRAKVKSFKQLDDGFGSSRLNDNIESVKALSDKLKSGTKSFAVSLEEALSLDSRASIPLTDACTVIERFEAALEASDVNDTASASSETTSMMKLIRGTLPLWNEVVVGSGSGRTLAVSAWELTPTDTKSSSPSSDSLLSIPSDIDVETGLVYAIDESLRAKIEWSIEDYLKETPDAAMFCPLVTDEEAPSYSCAVPRAMAFNKILKRLCTSKKSGQARCYYRSIDSLLGDLSAIVDNCILYNSVDSFVVEKALEIVPSVKRIVASVASQHFKEKEAIEKSAEERRQAIELQYNAPALRKEEGQQNQSTSRSRAKRQGLQPPYTEFLHRSWIQGSEPDGSWSPATSNAEHSSTIKSLGKSGWVPQSGDTIFYSRSLHAEFVKGHNPSLTTEQCELPVFAGEKVNENVSESQDAASVSGTTLSDDLQNRWLVGKVVRVRATFPRAPSKRDPDYENTFEVASPVLDLGIKFNYSWASNKIYNVSWRPCTFAKKEAVDNKPTPLDTARGKKRRSEVSNDDAVAATEEESKKPAAAIECDTCHLSTDMSFVRPAWMQLSQVDEGVESSTLYLPPDGMPNVENLFSSPTGIPEHVIGSIDRCLNVIKRRCLDGVPANHVDSKFNVADVKKGWSPPAPKIGRTLPAFDRVLAKGNAGSTDASTRGIEKVDKKAVALLADANYLPRWTLSLSEGTKKKTSRDGIAQSSLALHETLSPSPNFCLELIQNRLRNGYYRSVSALAHDIEEAYVSCVLLILAKPAAAKMGQSVSIRRIAKTLSATKDMVSFEMFDGKKAAKSGKQVTSDPSEKKAAKGSVLNENEQQWVDKIIEVRKLYATALACALQPDCMERIFGSVPKKKVTTVATETLAKDREQAFRKARNTLGYIYHSLQRDACDNRASNSWSPSVKVTIRFAGKERDDDDVESVLASVGRESRETIKPIIIAASDYENNDALVKFFFGRPLRMDSCARCNAYGRSTMMCRVRKNHSQPDFDWVSVFQGTGGIDGLLHTLRTGQPPPQLLLAPDAMTVQSHPPARLPSSDQIAAASATMTMNGDTNKPDPFALLEKAEAAVSLANEVLKKAQKFSKDPVRLSEEFVESSFPIDPEDGHYNYCILCGLIGDVICCETCPNVVHPRCVNLTKIPDEDWFCSRCIRKGKAPNRAKTEAATSTESKDSLVDVGRDADKDDGADKSSELREPSAAMVADESSGEKENDGKHGSDGSQESKAAAPTDSLNEEKKDDEKRSESKQPSKVAAAIAGADVLPLFMAAPYGLDDDADRLEAMLSELKSARPVRPKKVKKESKESKESSKAKDGDSSGDEEDEDDNAASQSPVQPRRATRKSAAADDEDSAGGPSDSGVAHQVGPQPIRIRVGTKVKKLFGKHGYFTGKVLEVPSSENPFYLVRYEDDDEEDMTEEELRKCILGPSAARSSGTRKSRRSSSAGQNGSDDDEETTEPVAKKSQRSTRARPSVSPQKEDDDGTTNQACTRSKSTRSSRRSGLASVKDDDDEEHTKSPAKKRQRSTRSRASTTPEEVEETATNQGRTRRRPPPSYATEDSEPEDEKSGHRHDTRSCKKRARSAAESPQASPQPKKRGQRGRRRKHR